MTISIELPHGLGLSIFPAYISGQSVLEMTETLRRAALISGCASKRVDIFISTRSEEVGALMIDVIALGTFI